MTLRGWGRTVHERSSGRSRPSRSSSKTLTQRFAGTRFGRWSLLGLTAATLNAFSACTKGPTGEGEENTAPVVTLSGITNPYKVGEPVVVTYRVSESDSDPANQLDGPFVLRWGDGSSDTVPVSPRGGSGTRTHVYESPSNRMIIGSIVDAGGLSGRDDISVVVESVGPVDVNDAPSVSGSGLSDTYMVGEPAEVSWDSFDPDTLPGFVIEDVAVDWGDGSSESVPVVSPSDAGSFSHVYSAEGDFTVTLTASDAGGLVGEWTGQTLITPARQLYRMRVFDATDHDTPYSGDIVVDGELLRVVNGVVEFLAVPGAVVSVATTGDWRRMAIVREDDGGNICSGAVLGATLDDRLSEVLVRVGDASDLVMFAIPPDEAERSSNEGWNWESARDNWTNSNAPGINDDNIHGYLEQFPFRGFGPSVDPNGLSDGEHDILQLFRATYTPATMDLIDEYQTSTMADITSQSCADVRFETVESVPAGRVALEWFGDSPGYSTTFEWETGFVDKMHVGLFSDRDNPLGAVQEEGGNVLFLPYKGRNEDIMKDYGNGSIFPSEYLRDAVAFGSAFGPLPRGIWTGQYVDIVSESPASSDIASMRAAYERAGIEVAELPAGLQD